MTSADLGSALLVAIAGALLFVALASLPAGSRVRRAYGTHPDDDDAARANAAVLAATGAFLLALAAATRFGVSDRLVAAGTLAVAAAGVVLLGWLVRYRDRRELLTTPNVDRERARRLGGAAMLVGGLLVVPLAAVLLGAGDRTMAVSTVAVAVLSTLLVAFAYR
ncbi:hypothetical protein SAMN04488066_11259 [Halorubrum aquaticum]|uniref:Uncharacterized protein n=1 Tax=Halorubrum aquaticum TaxID=387340 RepID=A0A1I3BGE9_9EURY|nr:hypothetical protein [Halorubrum aquaticum]SFH61358.1 hypothetical protein SAMN04488066_11259 [Halorubrum aquaticum]